MIPTIPRIISEIIETAGKISHLGIFLDLRNIINGWKMIVKSNAKTRGSNIEDNTDNK